MRYSKLAIIAGIMALAAQSVQAELVHQFKNPAFSGIGYSSHILTIESIEKSRRDAIESERRGAEQALITAQQNTPLARFMNLFQSQVYAQLSTQLSNNLFQNKCAAADGGTIPGCSNPTTGTFQLDGNTVSWEKTSTTVKMTVVDSAGTITVVDVPIASFSF
jgi:hypothetical protein